MRLLLSSLISLLFFVSTAWADSVLVLHANYGGAHTNVGSRLTTEGHTVTYSTGSVPTDVSSYQQIWDLRYNNTYPASEVTVLDNFVKNGGFLMMNGENSGFASRNNAIATVVSTAGGGTLTFGSGSNSYTVINTAFSNDTGTVTGAAGSSLSNSQGQYVFKTSGGVIGGMIWQSADLGSGYTGAIFVTADINLWDSTYGTYILKVNITDDILDMETAGTLYGSASSAPTYSSEPTSLQLQDRTNTRAITGSGIYIQQSGDNLNLDIQQYGDGQLIAGPDSTNTNLVDANVAGDYNTVNVKQGHEFGISTDNVLLFDINGNHNSLTVEQGHTTTDEGGHRAVVDVTGGYNTIELYQYDGGITGDHFAKITIGGDDNSVTSHQRDNSDKMLFLNITGDDNAITTNQRDTGEHFLDITAGSNQTISVTQENSGSHSATIDMSGYSSGLTLNQNSTTDQTYSINQNCLTSTGCGTTTVNQQ